MTIPLRDFQDHVYSETCDHWRKGAQNVCVVSPCGSGKTVVLAHAMNDEPGASLAVAHRQELVAQISMALARNGLTHRLMSTAKGATSPLLRAITAAHVYEFGRSYLQHTARAGVVGVDTLIRHKASDPFFESVRLLVQDECFPAGVTVGGKRIADIRAGDIVPAFNEASGGIEPRRVVRTFKNSAPALMWHIYCEGRMRPLCSTEGHPLWVLRGQDEPTWIAASDVLPGDCLLTACGWIRVMVSHQAPFDPAIDYVYNIEVEGLHTYIADGIVVHNCHHVQADNKWGQAAQMLPNARGFYPTATPMRADGRGLGRASTGLMDAMVLAPTMRQIIDMGFLTDYTIFCPISSKLHRERIKITSGGEYNQADAAREVREAQIVGDTVQAYLRHAKGKRAVVFNVSVDEAERTANAFRAAGIRAASLSADSPDAERLSVIGDLRAGRLDVLTNVDLFGEGFDLPAIECVIMARPTMSFGLYVQQFCRALRLLLPEWVRPFYNALPPAERLAVLAASDKPRGIIIDQVGNVEAHGLPDAPRVWSMEPRERGKRSPRDPDAIPLRVCLECYRPYERVHVACPYCGAAMPAPAERSGPEHVEGDLVELSPDVLAALRGEIARIDAAPRIPYGASGIVAASIRKKHEARQGAQAALRNAIAWWAGYRAACGDSEREGYRRFWYRYGVDVATAQTLGAGEASELAGRVMSDLQTAGVQFQPTNGN